MYEKISESHLRIAKKYFIQKKHTILHQNYRTKWGEIDIIALSPTHILKFIEVKNHKKEVNDSVKIEITKMLKIYTHKDVVAFISKKENLPRKIVYNYCLKFKK